ncbi:unnamed protein product [Prorocentrum cordatum]|uniref:Uncharacterized protein n=1 Tax=Prorocentrum cordatum TaxID=2364126 RepID=A0ABN9XSH0_9DINO|nr:unnamed protein product [Polarella glacialis]
MSARVLAGALCFLAVPCRAAELSQEAQHRANPIRKVVTMLQDMKKQVSDEGVAEEKAFKSIAASQAKIDALDSSIKELSEKKVATEAALKEHTASRAEAKETMSKATALRDTERKAALKFRSDSDVNISAIAAAVKELFKKTLPSASSSFVQVQQGLATLRAQALRLLRSAPSRGPEIDLVLLAMQGKTAGFEKVIKLIDEMMVNLKKEQADDDNKKLYCETELDKSEDQKKELERGIEVSSTAIEDLKAAIATWTQEIADLKAAIGALDKSVAEATKLRQEENAEFKELMQNNKASKEILLWAKNRLNKFYPGACGSSAAVQAQCSFIHGGMMVRTIVFEEVQLNHLGAVWEAWVRF